MDNRNNGYGPLLLLLSQFMGGARQNPPMQDAPDGQTREYEEEPVRTEQETWGRYFAEDETGAAWHREERVELLAQFCREGYAMARRHSHFLVGKSASGSFLAIPGRFLLEEQPAGGVTGFTLWQPLAGGEELYDTLENLSEDGAEEVYGYWIARLDPDTLKLSEV